MEQVFQVAPQQIYKTDDDGVIQINSYGQNATVGTDKLIVAAAAGYIHRVLSLKIFSGAGGITYFLFHSGTGTSKKRYEGEIPASSKDELLPFWGGYFETEAGEGLYYDIGTTAGYVNLTYITYKA